MNSRWDSYFMDVAFRTSQLSYAKKLQVGSVAVKQNRIILCGFNGTPSGDDNNCEDIIDGELRTKSNVLHSEENLILFAANYGISLNSSTIYITHVPCPNCSRLIYGSGINRVVYKNTYRDSSGLDFLKARNIVVDNI